MGTASAETRHRSTKLYSLLASLVRNRALSVVRATPNSDGYEALRQLILNLKPNTQARGLALLSAITSYPSFNMQKPLLSQLIKLEEMFEETRKSGTPVQEELKVAILLKCITGPLKTQLNLMLDGSAKYSDVRDQVLRWDRSQQKWTGLVIPSDDNRADDAVPMEVDRIGEKGWRKGKGDKGKSKGDSKGYSSDYKGKGKSKSKGKDGGKSFSKGDKGGKGKQNEPKGQGKSDKSNKQCFRCGKAGHYAKDCWSKVRVVQNSDQNQGSTSSAAGSNNNGQQQAQQNAQVSQAQSATQYRVSQISCRFGDNNASDESQPVVFDLRQDPISPCSAKSVRVLQQFFIGDDVEHARFHGDVRVLVEEVSDWDDGELKSILLDSGADAAVFPKEYATAGMASNMPDFQLHDAQGRQIPVMGMRDVEVHLTDETGRQVVLREHVAISSSMHQPILCFGRLMENGWGVNASEQNLVHATGVKIPIELQNRSMVVKGSIRAISCDEGSGEHPGQASIMVRAVKATVRDDVLHGRVGWTLDETGLGIGRHFAETYQDPTLVCPAMQGIRNRTTLIRGDDGLWYVLELCEPLQNLIDMSAEFYGYSGAREVLTFITEGEKPPGSMGFSMRDDAADLVVPERQDDGDQQDPDAIAPEDEVQGLDIGNQDSLMPSADGREIPADRVVVNAADFEKVIVNGVELTAESSLAALRSGCNFYGISQSGGKMKCYGRLVNHLKKLELELLKDAAQHAAAELERKPNSPTLAVPPSEEAQRQHELTHTHTISALV